MMQNPSELLDLADRHGRRSQTKIELPLEVNLRTKVEPKIVLIGPSRVESYKTN